MIDHFEILGANTARPDADRVIFQARFPLVGRVADQSGNATTSRLSPDHVVEALKGLFD